MNLHEAATTARAWARTLADGIMKGGRLINSAHFEREMAEVDAVLAATERCPYGGSDTPSSCILPVGHAGTHQRRRWRSAQDAFKAALYRREHNDESQLSFTTWLRAMAETEIPDLAPVRVAVVMVNDAIKCVEPYDPTREDEWAIRKRHQVDQLARFKERHPQGTNPDFHPIEVGHVHIHIFEVKAP